MWQWTAQSPGSVATSSMTRAEPVGTRTVVSGQRADGGTSPPSVPVTSNERPWRWIGWWSIGERFPIRMRTRSPVPTTSGAVPGYAFPLNVRRLKSLMAPGSGRRAPTGRLHSCVIRTKSRSTGGPVGTRGWTTIIPTRPRATCVISS